ncbi:MAG TPA: oligosaccharide flippase family protein [Longimicrobium sp.]|nr:oligosaccharide flippase family protein [Longimicrobium sp.]
MIYGLSTVVGRLLFIFLVPIYTRVFSPEEYGEMSLVLVAMTLVTLLATLALDNSAHRWFWDTEADEDRRRTIASWAWCQVGTSVAFALAISAAAHPLARLLMGRAGAAPYLVLAAWAVPLTAWSTVVTNWLRMRRRPWAVVGFTLATTVASIATTVLLVVVLHRGLRGVFEAQLLSMGAAAAVSLYLLGDWVHPRHFAGARLREMLVFALPLIPAAVAFWINGMGDRYFVQHYVTTAEVGLFQVGYAISAVVALGTTAFQQAWGPFALSIHRDAGARPFYAQALLLYLWIGLLGAAAVSVFSPEILRLFTTPAYLGAWTVVPFLAFSYVMSGLAYIAGLGPSLAKRTAPTAVAVGVASVLNLALNFVLTPRYGKEGSALATLLSQAVVPLYLFRSSQRMYPIPYRFGAAAALVAAAAGIAGLGLALGGDDPWRAVPLKLAVLALFVPLLFALGIVTPGGIRRLRAARPAVDA